MPLHFWDFISRLVPISSGYVKCDYCRCWIATDVSSVCAHFREAYIDPCIVTAKRTLKGQAVLKSYVDHLLSSLVVDRSSYAKTIQKSFSDHKDLAKETISIGKESDRKVPNLAEKLPDLAALCEALLPTDRGMIECQRSTCVKVAHFAAEWGSIAEHFCGHHCPHLRKLDLSNTYGVIEAMESILIKDRKSSLLLDDLIAIAQDGCPLLATTQTIRGENNRQKKYHRFKKQRQWLFLRQLRSIFSDRYAKFLGFIIDGLKHDESMSSHLSSYGHKLVISHRSERETLERCTGQVNTLLEKAILTLHDVNVGHTPTTLNEIVHFINLSYSMAELMKIRGFYVNYKPTSQDFRAWEQCLSDSHEGWCFQDLVRTIWSDPIISEGQVGFHLRRSPTYTDIKESLANREMEMMTALESQSLTPLEPLTSWLSPEFQSLFGFLGDTMVQYDSAKGKLVLLRSPTKYDSSSLQQEAISLSHNGITELSNSFFENDDWDFFNWLHPPERDGHCFLELATAETFEKPNSAEDRTPSKPTSTKNNAPGERIAQSIPSHNERLRPPSRTSSPSQWNSRLSIQGTIIFIRALLFLICEDCGEL